METIRILGPTRVEGPAPQGAPHRSTERCDAAACADLGGTKPRQVLELLALHHGSVLTKHQLAAGLWPDGPPRAADRTVESYVAVVRRHLEAAGLPRELVLTVPSGYVLSRTATCDLTTFRTVLHDQDAHAALALFDARHTDLAETLLASSPDRDWADGARSSWRDALADLHLLAAARALEVDRAASASWHAAHASALRPLGEHAVRLRMTALSRMEERALAIEAYLELRDRLREELGIDPSRLTTQAYLALLGSVGPTRLDHAERALVVRLYAEVSERWSSAADVPRQRGGSEEAVPRRLVALR